MKTKAEISWQDFEKLDMRTGTILSAKEFPAARQPAFQLEIDFGPLGRKRSSAQITDLYAAEDLVGKQILAVINFPPKQIANFFSECLILGVIGADQSVTLLTTEQTTGNGLSVG